MIVKLPDGIVLNGISDDLSTDEVRASLEALYPVVTDAQASRVNGVITFTRASGGTKGSN